MQDPAKTHDGVTNAVEQAKNHNKATLNKIVQLTVRTVIFLVIQGIVLIQAGDGDFKQIISLLDQILTVLNLVWQLAGWIRGCERHVDRPQAKDHQEHREVSRYLVGRPHSIRSGSVQNSTTVFLAVPPLSPYARTRLRSQRCPRHQRGREYPRR